MFLDAVIVFVGMAGNHHEGVERQLAPVLDHAGVDELVLPSPDLAAIVRHSDTSREVVKKLHVDGVIGAALITSNGEESFRLVIYDGNGNMRSLGETPLTKHKLTPDDLDVLGINLGEEISSLKPTPRNSVIAARPTPAPVPAPIPAPAPTRAAIAVRPEPTPPKDPEPETAAPEKVADANAVSLDDIEAMTGGGGGDVPVDGGSVSEPATEPSSTLHLHVAAGLGITGRSFSAPMGVTGYSSTPVSTVHFAAGVQPTERTSLDVAVERTISMSTNLDSGSASTMISRWQIDGGVKLVDNSSVQISANLGLGHRAFTIDAVESTGRTPDSEYNYIAIGARIAKSLGSHAVLRGGVELEPVFGGADAMQMTLGSSTRWGFDVGASVDYALSTHFIASAAFDYQQFSWSWSDGSGASDSYPTGTLALRSEF
jgi:hypothetical protein